MRIGLASGSRRTTHVMLVALAAALALPGAARAQGDGARERRAAEAYDAGIRAFEAEEYARAGEAFVTANRFAPSPIALAQAVRAYSRAREVRIAGTLGLRLLAQEGLPDVLHQIAEQAVADARAWYVRIDVACSSTCAIAVDGVIEESSRFFAAPDRDLRIVARFRNGETREEVVRARAGEARLVEFAASRAADEADAELDDLDPHELEAAALEDGENPYRISRGRFFSRPRASFFAVLVPTLVGAGMLTWSAVDTRRSRGDLRDARETDDPIIITRAETEHDRNVRRTKWIAVEEATFVFAAGVIAALTDWSPHGDDRGSRTDDSRVEVDVQASPAGVSATLRRSF